ncbi:MAG: hypothetical protein ABLT11_03080 [Candidatus Acidiferrum sp.]
MNVAVILKKYFVFALIIFIAGPALHAGTLGVNVVAMFPKSTAEFAYADLKEARKFPWYAQFKSQALPTRFSDLEHFLASVGVDDNVQIDELAWSLGSGDSASGPSDKSVPDSDQVLGIALGNFDVEHAKSYMKAHKIRGYAYRGYTLYPCASCDELSVAFIDSSTVAFGHPQLLEKLLDVRAGTDDSLLQNEKVFPLISKINGRGIFWGVLNQGGTRQAIRQIVPEATQFPQASKLLNKLNAMVISIEGSSDLEAHFQLVSSAPDDAATIAQLLQAGVLLKQFEAKNSDPELSALLGSVRVVPNGEGLEVSFSVSSDQVVSLIKRNTFSAKR